MQEKQTIGTDKFKLFGVDKEAYEKSQNINPVFDFSSVDIVEGIVLSPIPENVKHKAKFGSKFHKAGTEIVTPVLTCKVTKAFKNGIDISDLKSGVYSVWLSSVTLSMGFLKLIDGKTSLKDVKFRVKVEKAVYKDYGENTAYRVEEIK